jgi:hypothetical protein
MEAALISAMKGEKMKGAPQWRTWFMTVQMYAKRKNVWDLCNPDLSAESDPIRPGPLTKPAIPVYPEDGDEAAKMIWRDRMILYKVEYAGWKMQAQELGDVYWYIITSLDPILYLDILPYDTPYEILVCLKSRFAYSPVYRRDQNEMEGVLHPEANRRHWAMASEVGRSERRDYKPWD